MKTVLVVCVGLLVACNRVPPTVSGVLPQRGYLWQRHWTPAVIESLVEGKKRTDGVVILGAEILWTGRKPEVVRVNVDWEMLKSHAVACGVALRVALQPKPDDNSIRLVVEAARSLCDEAQAHSIQLTEFQLDFDCPQKELANYRAWLSRVREVVRPVRFVMTTLPAWLDEPEFVRLIREVDSYVLQVHSVPTSSRVPNAMLYDPCLARQWIAKATTCGRPFAVALPTYRCSAGYAPSGRLLSVAMDSVQPVWPADTRILEFETDTDAVAELVHELEKNRPQNLR